MYSILGLIVGFAPLAQHNPGRFIYLKIDFRRAKAIIAHVYKGEEVVPIEFRLKNLSFLYFFNGHSYVTTHRPRNSTLKIETTHLFDTYNLRAYDDEGARIDVRPEDPELVRILKYPEHAVRFDYMQFILNNYERFEKKALDTE